MISSNLLKKIFASLSTLTVLLSHQYSHAQDATVTFTSSISTNTCSVSINAADGSGTATVAMNGTSLAAGASGVAQYTKLTIPKAFTVGLKGSGVAGQAVTGDCAYAGKLNVYFGTAATNTAVSIGGTRAIQKPTSDTIGVGIELESVNAGTVTPIKDFSVPTYSGATLVSSQHGLASVSATGSGAAFNFQATAVKHFVTTTPITSGSVSIAIPVYVSYN